MRRPTSRSTSYAILRLDSDRLARESWDCVVLDEAQNIKNPDSQVAAGRLRPAGEGPHRADGDAGREPPRRALESVPLPESRTAGRPRGFRGAHRAAHRGRRHAGRGTPARTHPPLPAAAPQTRRGSRAASAQRDRAPLRTQQRGTRGLRRRARGQCRSGREAAAGGRQRDGGARSPAAPAPGGLSSRPGARTGGIEFEQGLAARRAPRAGRGRRAQGAGLLAVDGPARPRGGAVARGRHRLRAPRRQHARPRRGRRGLPGTRRGLR